MLWNLEQATNVLANNNEINMQENFDFNTSLSTDAKESKRGQIKLLKQT